MTADIITFSRPETSATPAAEEVDFDQLKRDAAAARETFEATSFALSQALRRAFRRKTRYTAPDPALPWNVADDGGRTVMMVLTVRWRFLVLKSDSS